MGRYELDHNFQFLKLNSKCINHYGNCYLSESAEIGAEIPIKKLISNFLNLEVLFYPTSRVASSLSKISYLPFSRLI